ncbi:GNAT family N-acetyltransferase [Paenibacillus gallinarum]|uniref:GNAT family N-acetyltransferase n=1 Tax=Paenibacillus gallinarum TaxID=2762232 RepID=A0ABR8T0K4_9BACL|nr:GNAT family N-acetyltransferase [Paenibacillus gallinarum]MBD7969310.1 GNAT family N-acetyltransferase [Paenibacillus gallinarum]
MYVYRSLEGKDLKAISTFPQSEEELKYISPGFNYPLTPNQIVDLSKDRLEPTVIIEQATDEVIAYANIYGYDLEKSICWLGNVIVSPKYRGQGASAYLLNVMFEKAKHHLGVRTIRLACHNTNSRGLAFYSKYGFKPYDMKITNIDDKRIISIHMSRELI